MESLAGFSEIRMSVGGNNGTEGRVGIVFHSIPRMSAHRAEKAVRPAPKEQRIPILLLATVSMHEFRQTGPFLKLNLILCHNRLLAFAQVYYTLKPRPKDVGRFEAMA